MLFTLDLKDIIIISDLDGTFILLLKLAGQIRNLSISLNEFYLGLSCSFY